jgi:hypothetical protein
MGVASGTHGPRQYYDHDGYYTGTVGREKRETAGRVATAVLGNIQ